MIQRSYWQSTTQISLKDLVPNNVEDFIVLEVCLEKQVPPAGQVTKVMVRYYYNCCKGVQFLHHVYHPPSAATVVDEVNQINYHELHQQEQAPEGLRFARPKRLWEGLLKKPEIREAL